ncbi:MAG TPA: hypothetical protein VNA26_04345 [Chitinophagaceae bacterium]|nr:hypothetical protein [Chitinophagaceae bacterium]
MKQQSLQYFIFAAAIVLSCSNDNTTKENTVAGKDETTAASAVKKENTVAQDGIVGTWMMHLDAYDHNQNEVLDADERSKAVANRYRMQLNADGTCRLMDLFTGRYETKTENGKKILRVFRKKVEGEEDKDPPPDVYVIKSLTKDELVLYISLSTNFWIFKREK